MTVFRKKLANGHPSPTWWWRARIAGSVICRSTGETSRAKAQKSANAEIARLRQEAIAILEPAGESGQVAPRAPAPTATIAEPAGDQAPAASQAGAPDQAPTPDAKPSPQPELFPEPEPTAPGPRVRYTDAQSKMVALVRDAAAGRLPWLAQAIGDAGYHRGRAAVVGATDLAALLSVSRQTIHTWTTRGCPRNTTPQGAVMFDVAAVAAWLYARGREDLEIANRRAKEAGNDAKRRDDEARADLRELDLAQRRGAVVETEELWRILLDWAGRFVAAFRARPAAWATALQGATAATIRGTIERDLSQIFDNLRKPGSQANIPPDAALLVREALEIVTAGPATPPAAPDKGPSHEPPPPPAPAAPNDKVSDGV